MSEKISSDIRAATFKEQCYPALFVEAEPSRVSYFQSLMEERQDGCSLGNYGKKTHHPTHRRAGTARTWQKDRSSTAGCYKSPGGDDEGSDKEDGVDWEEQGKNQCLLPLVATGMNNRELLRPLGLKLDEGVRDKETMEVSSRMQNPFLEKPKLPATVDHVHGGNGANKDSASLSAKGMNLMQCKLQELISRSVSRMEIQGAHALSIQPRPDKLQETLIEMQRLPTGGFVVCIVTSSKEALAVVRAHLGMIHSRFLEIFPFRPLQLKIKYSGNPTTEDLLQEKGELVPVGKKET